MLKDQASSEISSLTLNASRYVMTSEGKNHEETEKYFKDQEYFGYVNEAKEPQIYFFSQGVLPCLTNDGKIMLETGCKVGVAADGNGGIYKALQSTGKVADMKNRGVKYVHCFSVDNAISKVWPARGVLLLRILAGGRPHLHGLLHREGGL